MILSIKDRLLIRQLLPSQGNVLTLRVVKEIAEAIDFSTEELAKLEFKQEATRLTWNVEADEPVAIDLSKPMIGLIKDELRKLNDQQKLSLEQLSLYEMFTSLEEGSK